MAKCAICNKGGLFGKQLSFSRSHVSARENKMWKSNIKSVRVKTPQGNKKMYVCTSCLRSGKVERA